MATSDKPATPSVTSTGKVPSAGGKSGGAKKATVTMIGMAIMIVTTILSLRGLSSQAEYGYTSIFWYVLSAILFLIPFSLVCAELASTYTKSGGLFRWVSEAFGARWGWAALAYVFWPETFDTHLASNTIYTLIIVLAVYWLSTFNCFRGMRNANKLSTLGGLFGTIIPGAILIILGIVYICTGGENFIPTDRSFWPDFTKYSTIVLAASIFLFYGGMEMQAVHVNSMQNPQRDFPRAALVAVVIILAVFILGTLAIGFVMPEKEINLLQSLLVAYNSLWAHLGCPWLGNVLALFVTFGVIGQVSVIIAGPSTGILAVGKAGYLPHSLQKVNKNGVQTNILWVQGLIVTILALVLIVLPSVQSAYQVMSQMATVTYLVLVIMIYCAFFRLRHTESKVRRGYRVPGGNFGKWLVTLVGVGGAVAALVLSFLPRVRSTPVALWYISPYCL